MKLHLDPQYHDMTLILAGVTIPTAPRPRMMDLPLGYPAWRVMVDTLRSSPRGDNTRILRASLQTPRAV